MILLRNKNNIKVIAKYLLEGRSCDFCGKSLDCKLYGKAADGVCEQHVWALDNHWRRKTIESIRRASEMIRGSTKRGK